MRTAIKIFCFFMLAVSSCNKPGAPDCLKTTGEMTSEQRSLGAVNEIHLDDNINLVIHEDSIPKIIVEAGENLIREVKTEQNGRILSVFNDNKCNFMRRYDIPINVHVHTPALRKIFYNGGGNISSAGRLHFPYLMLESVNSGSDVMLDLDADSVFAVIHTGVSNIYLTGQSEYLYLYSVGNSIFHAENFPSEMVHCNNGSTGDFFVNATSFLHVEIRSYSTTWYRGNPVVTIADEGEGSVTRMGQ